MKLLQHLLLEIEDTNNQPADGVEAAQNWFANEYSAMDKPVVTGNDKGTIDIKGSFWHNLPLYPDNLPRIRSVTGVYSHNNLQAPRSAIPQYVGQSFELAGRVGKMDTATFTMGEPDDVDTYKLSEWPRSTGKGFLQTSNYGRLVIDDPSVFSGYYHVDLSFAVVEGVEKLPTDLSFQRLVVRDQLEKIPHNLNVADLRVEVSDGASLKGIHKTWQNLSVPSVWVVLKTPGPIVGLLTGLPNCKEVQVVGPGLKMAEIKKLRQSFLAGELDVFEIQEQLIDAGLGKYAKR